MSLPARLKLSGKFIGILGINKPPGVEVRDICETISSNISNIVYRNYESINPPTRVVYVPNKETKKLEMKIVKDYSKIAKIQHEHNVVAVQPFNPVLTKIQQGVTMLRIGHPSHTDFVNQVFNHVHTEKTINDNFNNHYILHYMLGMSSKDNSDIINERQTYSHITIGKLENVVQILNNQSKQHVLLKHDEYFDDKNLRTEKAKNLSDEEFDKLYLESMKGERKLKKRITRKSYKNKTPVVNQIKLNTEESTKTLPYFKLYVQVQNEQLENLLLFKKLTVSLAGKLNCVTKLVRVERVKQFCYTTNSNCLSIDDVNGNFRNDNLSNDFNPNIEYTTEELLNTSNLDQINEQNLIRNIQKITKNISDNNNLFDLSLSIENFGIHSPIIKENEINFDDVEVIEDDPEVKEPETLLERMGV